MTIAEVRNLLAQIDERARAKHAVPTPTAREWKALLRAAQQIASPSSAD